MKRALKVNLIFYKVIENSMHSCINFLFVGLGLLGVKLFVDLVSLFDEKLWARCSPWPAFCVVVVVDVVAAVSDVN